MKAESMTSENLKDLPTKVRSGKGKKERRRATDPARISEGGQETPVSPAARAHRLSADNPRIILLPKTKRSSQDELLPAEQYTSTKVDQPVKLLIGERELGQKPITIMSVLRLNCEKYPERNAYAFKPDDTWQYITYKDLFDRVRRVAKGFIAFGLQRYYGVAIIGRNAPEWAIANFAAIYAGGIVVPIPTALSVDDCRSIIQNTRCSIVVVGSSKQLETVAQIRSQLPYIKAVIKWGKDDDEKSVQFYTWEKLLEMGDKVNDDRLIERISFQAPNLCCTIMHTSGTTGPKKPAMYSQDGIVWGARTMGRRLSCSVASGVMMSVSSYANICGLMFDLYVPLMYASTVYFISSPNVFEWTKEVQPTILYAPRLIFEELRLKMMVHLTRSRFARIIYWWAKSIGLRGIRAITSRRPMPIGWSLANARVYQKIRTMLGVQNCHEIFVAGSTGSPKVLEFFASLNLPVLEIYGMTECSGPVTMAAMPDMFRILSIGKDMEGCYNKIVEPDKNGIGHLLVRSRQVFMGYLNQPEMTNAAFDKDGWYKTEDLARKDKDGFMYAIGRLSDLITLESGETIHARLIEIVARDALPFIRKCMLVGNGKPYLAMLLTIKTVVDWQTFEVSNILTPDSRQWFQKLGYQDETIDRFLQNPDKRILNKIQTIFDRLNAETALPSHRIQKWTILPQDFTVRGGELTWILSIRRFFIEEKYAETINSMYIEK